MFQKIEIEIDIPDGYEFVRYGVPSNEEYYISTTGRLCKAFYTPQAPCFIVRKIKRWRKPVLPADYGKQARFSDDGAHWLEYKLGGWSKSEDNDNWLDDDQCGWKFCQVCDEETK